MANGICEHNGYEYNTFTLRRSDGAFSASVCYRKLPDGAEATHNMVESYATDDLGHINARIWLQDLADNKTLG